MLNPAEDIDERAIWTNGLDHLTWAVLIADAATGQIIAANTAARAMSDQVVPSTLFELANTGRIMRSDYERIKVMLDEGQQPDQSVATTLTIRNSSGMTQPADVMVARIQMVEGIDLIIATARWFNDKVRPAKFIEFTEPLVMVCDEMFVIQWLDEGLLKIGVDVEAHIGTHVLATLHPVDLALYMPRLRELAAGQVSRVDFTSRTVTPYGEWGNVHLRLDRLVGDTCCYLVHIRPAQNRRKQLDLDGLTKREHTVVVAIFEGLRTSQIALRDGVSTKTIRNQLSNAYGKLGISSQEELLATYDPPLTIRRSVR